MTNGTLIQSNTETGEFVTFDGSDTLTLYATLPNEDVVAIDTLKVTMDRILDGAARLLND